MPGSSISSWGSGPHRRHLHTTLSEALVASLVPASDGLGVWYLLGDETTEDEGPNMQLQDASPACGFGGERCA